jgi:hypothetical protein
METIVDTAFDYLIVGKGEHRDDGPRAALVLILAVREDGWLRPLAKALHKRVTGNSTPNWGL